MELEDVETGRGLLDIGGHVRAGVGAATGAAKARALLRELLLGAHLVPVSDREQGMSPNGSKKALIDVRTVGDRT